jgi:integrase
MTRHHNAGLRKVCSCPRRSWPKCHHSWHFNFRWRGVDYRLSLNRELGRHIAGKTEANTEAENLRNAIRADRFQSRADRAMQPTSAVTPNVLTLSAFAKIYFERRGRPATANEKGYLKRLVAFTPDGQRMLGDTPIEAITEDQIELFFGALLQQGRSPSMWNQNVQLVKALFRWSARKGYVTRNPVADSEVIRRKKQTHRNRRLVPDVLNATGQIEREGEERRLLAVAGPHLQRVIIVALDSGMRRGEILSLKWQDVNFERNEITLHAAATKTRTGRVLPISTRLAAILDMAHTRLDNVLSTGPAKQLTVEERSAMLAQCYVFGDDAGRKVGSVKRAWETAVLKAHHLVPVWGLKNRLSAESRTALRGIDLHFHDLRHEAGSRLLEHGWPLHHVRDMLGHANVSQTSTYLNAVRGVGLHESMRRFPVCKTVADSSSPDPLHVCNSESRPEAKSLIN